MRTDRELLELAAKAAGITVEWHKWPTSAPERAFYKNGLHSSIDGACYTEWRPIHDDGDALRLAVRLKFDVWIGIDGTTADGVDCEDSECNGDPYAATRRAIVRAAAEIGAAKVAA